MGPRILIARHAQHARPAWSALRRTLLSLLETFGVRGTLSLALVDDAEMRRLHRQFLAIDSPTDVLSFPLGPADGSGPGGVFGEVVVSVETARRESRRRRLPPGREAALYAIHGTLHLVGFDDDCDSDRARTRRMERQYLNLYERLRRGGGRITGPATRRRERVR